MSDVPNAEYQVDFADMLQEAIDKALKPDEPASQPATATQPVI